MYALFNCLHFPFGVNNRTMAELPKLETLSFPPLGLGCMSLPEDFLQAEKVLHAALDHGLTFFDTADLYQKGTNESNIGRALGSKRSQLLLASKVGNQWNPDGKSWTWNPTKTYLINSVEESLRRLRTDYLDLCQLHGGTIGDHWEEIVGTFELLKNQGKIRAFGISSIRPNVIRKLMAMNPPASVMMQYSPLDRRPEEAVFPLLEKTKTKVLVRGAFAKGILIDKPIAPFLDFSAEAVSEIKSSILDLGYGAEAVLIRFGLIEKAVSTLVIGASSVDQVANLCAGYEESKLIPEELILDLKRNLPTNRYLEHR
jgi:aryl-alcohol dehydrogenase-like predicted oxidoreductase